MNEDQTTNSEKNPPFYTDAEITSLLSWYDEEEIIPNCTVQILRNSKTGEVSVGWWRNEPEEEIEW